MFNEYDVVIATRDLSECIKAGCVGTVLLCFGEDYEIEFIDQHGESLEVLTVCGSDLKLKIKY